MGCSVSRQQHAGLPNGHLHNHPRKVSSGPIWNTSENAQGISPDTTNTSDFYASVKIELEDVEDELQEKIPAIPEDSSPPHPPTQSRDAAKPTANWFAENIQTQVPLIFKDIDQHARRATKRNARTLTSLIKYLTSPLSRLETGYRELLTVRAIVAWLSNQNIDAQTYKRQKEFTPEWFLWMLKEKRTSYATFFSALCREAKLECVLLDGSVKAGDYEAGDVDPDKYHCTWNAVKINDQWQLVHPFWICRVRIGRQIGGWVKVESDGKAAYTAIQASKGVVQNAFQEYYFLVNPEEYIYRCYPRHIEWQLLPEAKQVTTSGGFMQLPYLHPPYFSLGLQLVSKPNSCMLKSTKGLCRIEFLADTNVSSNVTMQYDLYMEDKQCNEQKHRTDFQRFVFHSRNGERIYFEIRFPEEGTYKLILYGGKYGDRKLRCCEFRIDCEEPLQDCRLLPAVKGNHEWGPGPAAIQAGLLEPSMKNGLISVHPQLGQSASLKEGTDIDLDKLTSEPQPCEDDEGTDEGQVANIKFNLDRDKMGNSEYKVEMTANDYTDGDDKENLQKHVQKEVDRENATLVIQVTIPTEGEFALTISVGRIEGERHAPACHYLVTSFDDDEKRMAREILRNALNSDKIDEIESAISKARSVHILERDGDIRAARDRIILLEHRRESLTYLESVLTSSDPELLETAIDQCSKYGVENDDPVMLTASNRVQYLKKKRESEAKQCLKDAMLQESSLDLERAMDVCRNVGIDDDDDDMQNARNRLVQLKHMEEVRTHLSEMVEHGDIEEIEAAINECLEAGIDSEDKDIAEAQTVLEAKKKRREAKKVLRKQLASCQYMELYEAIGALELSIQKCLDVGVDANDDDVIKGNIRLSTFRKMAEAKERLLAATKGDVIEDIQQAVHRCIEVGFVEEDSDILEAKDRIYFLQMQQEARQVLVVVTAGTVIEDIDFAIKVCHEVDIGDDDDDVIKARERIRFLKEKQKAKEKMMHCMKVWYVSNLKLAVNTYLEYCIEDDEEETEVVKAKELLRQRDDWDKGISHLVKSLGETPDSLRVKLLENGRKRDVLARQIKHKARIHTDPKISRGLLAMIEQSDMKMHKLTSEKNEVNDYPQRMTSKEDNVEKTKRTMLLEKDSVDDIPPILSDKDILLRLASEKDSVDDNSTWLTVGKGSDSQNPPRLTSETYKFDDHSRKSTSEKDSIDGNSSWLAADKGNDSENQSQMISDNYKFEDNSGKSTSEKDTVDDDQPKQINITLPSLDEGSEESDSAQRTPEKGIAEYHSESSVEKNPMLALANDSAEKNPPVFTSEKSSSGNNMLGSSLKSIDEENPRKMASQNEIVQEKSAILSSGKDNVHGDPPRLTSPKYHSDGNPSENSAADKYPARSASSQARSASSQASSASSQARSASKISIDKSKSQESFSAQRNVNDNGQILASDTDSIPENTQRVGPGEDIVEHNPPRRTSQTAPHGSPTRLNSEKDIVDEKPPRLTPEDSSVDEHPTRSASERSNVGNSAHWLTSANINMKNNQQAMTAEGDTVHSPMRIPETDLIKTYQG